MLLCPTQQGPKGRDCAGIGSRGALGNFPGGQKRGPNGRGYAPRPVGPRLRGMGSRGRCPLPLGKKIFDFRTSLDPFLDHFLQFFSFLSHLFTYKLSFHFFPAATPPQPYYFASPAFPFGRKIFDY